MISDEAVEAAAKAVHDEFCRDQYHAGHIGPACYDYKYEARTILEAAAPHILAPEPGSAMREAMELVWDQAIDACREESAIMTGSEARKLKDANPYRSQL